MRFFAPDLYRNFGIGFAVGAALIAGVTVDQWGSDIAPAVQAAEISAPFRANDCSPQ